MARAGDCNYVGAMLTQRWRPVFVSVLAVLGIWLLAVGGYLFAKSSQPTAEKVRAYVGSQDLSKLSGSARAKAIQTLADKLNALPLEERQRARMERVARPWFERMTEVEKAGFIEATLPSSFNQMLTAFEQLPEDKRRRVIADSLRHLKETQDKLQADGVALNTDVANFAALLTPEFLAKLRTGDLKALYAQSSPQIKAELAPVLEELQRVMESGSVLRDRRRPGGQ